MTTYTTISVTFTDVELAHLDAYCEKFSMSREAAIDNAWRIEYKLKAPILSSAKDAVESKGNRDNCC